eukprot:m.186375 g.186375  ORF g.186375 m.186375 type:complete len:650 (+) comp16751_c0_seq1:111-2060(+)
MNAQRALGQKRVDWVGVSQLWEYRRGDARTGTPGAHPKRLLGTETAAGRFRSDAARSLVNQGHSVFVKMKQLREGSVDVSNLDPKDCLDICNEYRLVLQTCSNAIYERFRQAAEQGVLPDPSAETEYEELLQMDQVWSLAEVFFVREKYLRKHGGYVVQSLCAWVKQHFSSAAEEARALLRTGEQLPPAGESATVYWTAVFQMLFQGEVDTVLELFGLHADAHVPGSAVSTVRRLLDEMPSLGVGDGITEFLRVWKLWQKGCQEVLRTDAAFDTEPQLELVLRLLAGDVGVFDELKEYADLWCQLLVARLLYTNPLARFYDLQIDIDWARTTMGTGDDSVQELYYHIMTLDPFALIKGSCECFNSWWLPVHLIDILIGLKVKFGGHAPNLRAFLFREFTEHLMSEPSLFAIVPSYFTSVGDLGLDYLECFLERVPIESETKARKLLRVCALHGLVGLEQSICRVMGRRAVGTGQLGSALGWYTRAGDDASLDIVAQLADTMLRDYQQARLDGKQPDLQRKVKALLPALTSSGRLEFLRDYCEFLDNRQRHEYHDAAVRLISFFQHDSAPRWFWVDLLLDALPLLEVHENVVFSEEQTLALMQILEGLSISMNGERYLTLGHSGRREQIEELRLALARNLASAIMCPDGV